MLVLKKVKGESSWIVKKRSFNGAVLSHVSRHYKARYRGMFCGSNQKFTCLPVCIPKFPNFSQTSTPHRMILSPKAPGKIRYFFQFSPRQEPVLILTQNVSSKSYQEKNRFPSSLYAKWSMPWFPVALLFWFPLYNDRQKNVKNDREEINKDADSLKKCLGRMGYFM